MQISIRTRYSRISDRRLDSEVRDICDHRPHAGYRMVSAYLRACGFRVQEARVRESLERVDGVGVAVRWSQNRIIHRLVYDVHSGTLMAICLHLDGGLLSMQELMDIVVWLPTFIAPQTRELALLYTTSLKQEKFMDFHLVYDLIVVVGISKLQNSCYYYVG